MASQGGQANITGNVLERLVISTLDAHGFELVKWKDFVKKPARYGSELLLQNVPYQTIYGSRGFTEFLIRSERFGLETRIECKWQQTPGSVDEKLPYVYLSCAEAAPENEIIILIDGEGFRQGAIDWLRNAASEGKYIPPEAPRKVLRVLNSTEFLTWCNKTFV